MVALDPEIKHAIRRSRLRYVNDDEPGISRRKSGRGFSYRHPDGTVIRDKAMLTRIRSLAVPPAYQNVWICIDERGHLQATGRDARGRKQYRYHPRWREVRDRAKYDKLVDFGLSLPKLRERVAADMRRQGLPREKVLATVIRLLETSHIRIGNEVYRRTNGTYGLTTLDQDHLDIIGQEMVFEFRAKTGKMREVHVRDRRLARVLRTCQDLPGQRLFQYLDRDGERHSISSHDVNDYLHEISGHEFTAKDFRTWAGTLLAAQALRQVETPETKTAITRAINTAVDEVARELSNTRAVCRNCYIHPMVIESFVAGTLAPILEEAEASAAPARGPHDLSVEEAAVLTLLES